MTSGEALTNRLQAALAHIPMSKSTAWFFLRLSDGRQAST